MTSVGPGWHQFPMRLLFFIMTLFYHHHHWLCKNASQFYVLYSL